MSIYERISDEVHGIIRLNDIEDDIRKTKKFRRLIDIKQVGTGRWIFGASHFRSEHSLGTMHITGEILYSIFDKLLKKIIVEDHEKVIRSFRIAALLHDIGHGPFSHSLEGVLKDNPAWRPKIKYFDIVSERVKEDDAKKHEDFTQDIILTDKEIESVFKKHHIDKRVIAAILNGKYLEYGEFDDFCQLVSGDMDADRIDYIIRDTQNIGGYAKLVRGLVDPVLIAEAFSASYDKNAQKYRLFIPEKETSIVDLFLTVRYSFLKLIPHNPKIIIADRILQEAIETRLRRETHPRKKLAGIFTKMNDYDLLQYLNGYRESAELVERLETANMPYLNKLSFRDIIHIERYSTFRLLNHDSARLDFERNLKLTSLETDDFYFGFSIPKTFPKYLQVQRKIGGKVRYELYDKLSSFSTALGRAALEESSLVIGGGGKLRQEYIKNCLKEALQKTLDTDFLVKTDRVLMIFYAIDKNAREYFIGKKIISNKSHFVGPLIKGDLTIHRTVRKLQRNGIIPTEYNFNVTIAEEAYSGDLEEDLTILTVLGLIEKRTSMAIASSEEFLEYYQRFDFRLTRFGREYVEKYLVEESLKEIDAYVRGILQKDIPKSEKLGDILEEEKPLLAIYELDRTNENVRAELKKLAKKARRIRKGLDLNVGYTEDPF